MLHFTSNLKLLFLPAEKHEIGSRYFFHAELPEHGHQLTAVVSSVVENMQQHFIYRLLELFLLVILLGEYMTELGFGCIVHPLFP